MATPKIILCDVDGTLTDYENNLPASAVEAIHRAQANGHKFYACTGRSKAEMYDYILAIGLDGMIGGNGCYIESGDTVVFHQLIPAEVERRVVDWLNDRGLCFYLESNNGLFASATFDPDANEAIRAYGSGKGKIIPDVHVGFPEMIFDCAPEDLYRDDVNKISFVLKSYQDHLDSAEAFPELKAGTWGGAGEKALFGDLGVQDITKAFAVGKLCEFLGVTPGDCIAFGDAKVDIPMFEACGHSCCMGSGGIEAKEAAEYVTTNVDDDGLYNAFLHFVLI
ncbi:MAG: HAD family phosphatase [Atopobiaceae bacterium]|nr:HAD family phosphatase [Atopobiaceae bacterium]